MKIEYKDVELKDYDKISSQPLRYRVKLSRCDDCIVIQREYFKSVFRDGERDDNIFIPYFNGRGGYEEELTCISIMIQNVDDIDYLKSFEKN